MKRPKALFLDIDGTLLKNDHSLSDRVAAAVHRASERGLPVILASGRSWEALKPLYHTLRLNGPTVCYNGAVIVAGKDGRVHFEIDMNEQVARAAIEESRRLPKIGLVAYHRRKLVCEDLDTETSAYRDRVRLPASVENFDDWDSLNFTKLILLGDPEILGSVKETFETCFAADRLSITFSDRRFLEMMAPGVDKGRGMREACVLMGIDPKECLAIGDGWNDWPLFQTAGTAIVMGGAPESLKERFPPERVAPHADEDGVAVVIEELLKSKDSG